jgi:hypothetical protein
MTSKIKVDNIENQCGGAVVTKCGATTTISGSVVKADDIQAADGGNLINQCGTTITLGASGDTINLASGAPQTGFGRTGTVDWDTTAKTASFTAVSGNGYFCDTTSSAFTATLPAGSAGDIVSFADYAGTWQTNGVTVTPNGTDKIGGVNVSVPLSIEGQSVTFVYVDSTQGWLNTMDSTSNVRGNPFIVATGGTITTCGDYKIHTFTGPGTFAVTNAGIGTPCAPSSVDYLVVAGGGGGSAGNPGAGAGGGAGGYRESSGAASGCYSASPLGACVAALPVSVQSYTITVGGGGNGGSAPFPSNPGRIGTAGSNSIFSSITSAGGGGGTLAVCFPGNGGSGGGSTHPTNPVGAGNTPPVSPPQGNPGGLGAPGASGFDAGGGGGGATVAGTAGANPGPGGPGGNGATTSISASPTVYAGGGGGGKRNCSFDAPAGSGGTGGGGAGSLGAPGTAVAGTANTGGGGGAGAYTSPCGNSGANGGSGIVIIRYKYQ